MQPREIYKALEENKVSARMLAQALGVTNQSVSEVIRSGRGSKRIAESVAKVLKKELIEVFPYYAEKPKQKDKIAELKELLKVG